jgi:hypothetical protein
MIFEGQNSIHETMRVLNRKLDEMIGRQEQSMSQLSMLRQQGGVPQGTPVSQAMFVG